MKDYHQLFFFSREEGEGPLTDFDLHAGEVYTAGDNTFLSMMDLPRIEKGTPCKATVLHLARDEDSRKWWAQLTLHNGNGQEEVSATFPVVSCRKSWRQATDASRLHFQVPRPVLHMLNEADDVHERLVFGFKLKIFSV